MSGSRQISEDDVRRMEEAAAWRFRLTESGEETTEAFELWHSADPRNAAAWTRVQSPWTLLGEMERSPEVIDARQAALGHAAAAARTRTAAPPARFRVTGLRAAAAMLLVFAAGALLFWHLDQPDVYQTAMGERRVMTLDDGSELALDSNSEVHVSFSAGQRSLDLVRGQARFTVARNVERPFSVSADGRKVVATGTVFNVDLLDNELLVTLLEGRVIVLPGEKLWLSAGSTGGIPGDGIPGSPPEIELAPGNQLVVATATPPTIRPVNLELAMAWESGRLVFENEPLSTVAARVSRYSDRTLRVDDVRAADLRISGVFNAGDVDGFLATVTSYLPIRTVPGANGSIVLQRN